MITIYHNPRCSKSRNALSTIQKSEKDDPNSEADLKGHIEVQIQEEINEAKKAKIADDNIDLYDKDYQLARAIDLVRGISVYKSTIKK
jgi:arsenate reductase-like glutaredoxin family protein